MTKASAKETTNAVAYFVGLHNVVSVDEDGFITAGGDRLVLGKDDEAHPVAIYQDPMPDASLVGSYYVCNPFALSARASTAMRFVYRSQRTTISSLILSLLKLIVIEVLNTKKVKIAHDEYTDITLRQPTTDLVAGKTEDGKIIGQEIDEKTFHEVLSLSDIRVVQELVQRIFVPSKVSVHINIPFLNNPSWFKENFDINLRKKTLSVLKALILGVFGVKSGAELSKKYTGVQEEDGEPANFAGGVRMLYKLHKVMNPYFVDTVDDNVVDLEALGAHIGRLKAYTNRARMVVSDKISKPKIVEAQIPNVQRQPMQQAAPQMPIQQQQPQYPQPQQQQVHFSQFRPQAPQMVQQPQPAFGYAAPQMSASQQAMMRNAMNNGMVGFGQPQSAADRLPPSRRSFGMPQMPQQAMANMGFAPQYPQQPMMGNSYPVDRFGRNFGELVNNAPFINRG